MTDEYKPGFVRNIENQICGYNVSPTICIPFSEKEIEEALQTYLVDTYYLTKEVVKSNDIVLILQEIKHEIEKIKLTEKIETITDDGRFVTIGEHDTPGIGIKETALVIIDKHISDIGGTE